MTRDVKEITVFCIYYRIIYNSQNIVGWYFPPQILISQCNSSGGVIFRRWLDHEEWGWNPYEGLEGQESLSPHGASTFTLWQYSMERPSWKKRTISAGTRTARNQFWFWVFVFFFFLRSILFMCECFTCMYMCSSCFWRLEECQIPCDCPWDWSDIWLWVTI